MATPTHFDHRDHLITIAAAAKQAGVPYQYIHGVVKRAKESMNPSVYTRMVLVGGTKRQLVCSECIKDKYGTVQGEGEYLVSPIQAYRVWNIVGTDLVSWYNGGFVWEPEGVQAACDKEKPHKVPGPKKCGCGLYAVSKPDRRAYAGDVLGAVELWGRYVPGDKGWRAEWGKPVALLCDVAYTADKIHRVATRYKIPVTHSIKFLSEITWGEFGGELDGYWQGGEAWGGSAETEAGTDASSSRAASRAACRDTAAGARSVDELRRLYKDGVISLSNVEEVLES